MKEKKTLERKKMFRLYPENDTKSAYYGDNIKDMIGEVGDLSDLYPGQKFTVQVVVLTQEQIDAMHEFDGF